MQKGIAASPGIEIGKVYVFNEKVIVIDKSMIPREQAEAEVFRFEKAIDVSMAQVEAIKEKAEKELGEEHAQILTPT